MAKAGVGTPKHAANKLKAAGLQKLVNYCQACSKQCRDANGFKNHILSPTHLNNLQNMGSNQILVYSQELQSSFLRLLRLNHGEKRINANRFYQEYIQDKEHTRMNATRWGSLTQFVAYLGQAGLVRVSSAEEDTGAEPGLFIAYVDNSPEAVQRALALEKKGLGAKTDEEVGEWMLQEKMKRAEREQAAGKIAGQAAGQVAGQTAGQGVEPAAGAVASPVEGPVRLTLKAALKPKVGFGFHGVVKPVKRVNAFKVVKPKSVE